MGNGSLALFVDVQPVSVAGRFSINEYAERHRLTPRRRAHDEIDVTRIEEYERYIVVEKVELAAQAARKLNPRARGVQTR